MYYSGFLACCALVNFARPLFFLYYFARLGNGHLLYEEGLSIWLGPNFSISEKILKPPYIVNDRSLNRKIHVFNFG